LTSVVGTMREERVAAAAVGDGRTLAPRDLN
jgi:hypothetical protein